MSLIESSKKDHIIAWLAALAITIHIIESALPTPLPGVKPGLANVVTLVALLLWGWRVASIGWQFIDRYFLDANVFS